MDSSIERQKMNDLFNPERLFSASIEVDANVHFEWSENAYGGIDLHLDGGHLTFYENFFSEKVSRRTFAYLQENDWKDWRLIDWKSVSEDELKEIQFRNILWKQDHIRFFGKILPLPRLTAWYGDPGAAYKYSGIQSDPNPWNEGLLYLRNAIQRVSEVQFNSVLLNWYRDGSDSLSWHADDEKELGENPTIASASFGATREFHFRQKNDEKKHIKFKLKSGSLVIMQGSTQKNWVHSVPKRKSSSGSRFNLTFREILRV